MAKISFLYFDVNAGYYPSLHHGLASLIAALKNRGHSVTLNHMFNDNHIDEVIEQQKKESPDICAISFVTNQKKYVRLYFDKAEISSRLVIAGGVHPTLVKDKVFDEFPELEGFCIGDGEAALVDLCERFDKGEPYLSTPSFHFNTKEGIVRNPVAPLLKIHDLPLPDYSLFDYKKIVEDNGQMFPMMLARGCPYNCSYCSNHAIKEAYPNKKDYVRSPSVERSVQIIKKNLELYPKTEKIVFADDTFTLRKGWLAEFCEIYKKEINLPFICNARVETMDDDTARVLKEAGCVSISYGVESGNEWLRKNVLNRKHSNKKLKEAFRITKKYGIQTFAFNMVGFPFETKEMIQDTIDLNMELQANFGKCFFFYPFPENELYQKCIEYGMLMDDIKTRSGYLEGPTVKEVFVSHKEIRDGHKKMEVFFHARLLFSKVKVPFFIEKILIKAILTFASPIYFILDPTQRENSLVMQLRRGLRKIAMKHLR